jgi:hypothetical protein
VDQHALDAEVFTGIGGWADDFGRRQLGWRIVESACMVDGWTVVVVAAVVELFEQSLAHSLSMVLNTVLLIKPLPQSATTA